ncbi:MAG: pilus assembly protein [Planctomycetales bacterium]|nr:pilus assembly protein [Planctomycetales bacterium]
MSSNINEMPRTRRKQRLPKRKGAAVVEFAVVAPFLMLMLLGMIEFGRAMIIQQNVTTAAREACREATLPSATTASATAVAEQFASQIPNEGITVTFAPSPEDAEAGDIITATVEVPISAISNLGAIWFGSGATLDASAAMRKEGFE